MHPSKNRSAGYVKYLFIRQLPLIYIYNTLQNIYSNNKYSWIVYNYIEIYENA